jgi:hypothetical protein
MPSTDHDTAISASGCWCKPFPEGVDEATVCEAIDSKEPDLWVRFGHLVPAYVTGAVYVLETGPETKDKLFKYIGRHYVYGYYSQQASCRGSLTLLYIRSMFDKSNYRGKPFGREHLSRELAKKFGITTRESFQFKDERDRLASYCANPDLCEHLVKLDRVNRGEGMCARALVQAGLDEADAKHMLPRCRALPLGVRACAYQGFSDNFARDRCACLLRVALGLPMSGQCERDLSQ